MLYVVYYNAGVVVLNSEVVGWDPGTKEIVVYCKVARWFVFKPKIPILGKFWRVLQWKILVYFMTIR
jgi:hypothetical protein